MLNEYTFQVAPHLPMIFPHIEHAYIFSVNIFFSDE